MGITVGPGINIGPGILLNSDAATPSYVTSGLILYLDAGNPASYPGSGTTWTDLSSSAKNGSLNGTVGYNSANSGSLTFNGTNSIVTVSSATSITGLTNNFSAEVWYQGNNFLPRLMNTGVSSQGFNFGYFSSQPTKYKVTKYGVVDIFLGTIPQDNNWHQAVVTYSSTAGVVVYVDGASSGSQANNSNLVAGSATISIGQSEGGYHNGNISIVRMYNTTLSSAQVLQNFNANKTRYGL